MSDVDVYELFACACGDERQAIWDDVLREVAEEICNGDVGKITTALAYRLVNYSAGIDAIPADQWCAVVTSTYDGVFRTRIQCDRVEHGLAATWIAYKERFPEGHYLPPDDEDDDNGVDD